MILRRPSLFSRRQSSSPLELSWESLAQLTNLAKYHLMDPLRRPRTSCRKAGHFGSLSNDQPCEAAQCGRRRELGSKISIEGQIIVIEYLTADSSVCTERRGRA